MVSRVGAGSGVGLVAIASCGKDFGQLRFVIHQHQDSGQAGAVHDGGGRGSHRREQRRVVEADIAQHRSPRRIGADGIDQRGQEGAAEWPDVEAGSQIGPFRHGIDDNPPIGFNEVKITQVQTIDHVSVHGMHHIVDLAPAAAVTGVIDNRRARLI